ncbi:hypothetical protein [Paraburkholderia sp. Ac-20347]|uniref:hypothetical protein n=1 Tax=Paraburkholderia sp. Ac-20347 TaxID=2703892 RepID=UPI0019800CA4|nr:hypothetical protein [Paraburkholderia sp. Ac-20347]MBN3809438.1 hypothetical protein [Paraburkholderia sp. Ac-20347]
METLTEPRYVIVGPCRTGFIWRDTQTGLYPVFASGVDPNSDQTPRRAEIDYKAGWHSR